MAEAALPSERSPAAGRTALLDGTVMELASAIGLSHDVLYHTLAELKKEGVLSWTRSAIALRKSRGV